MKKILLIAVLSSFSLTLKAQSFEWMSGFGHTDNEFVFSSTVDSEGNSYLVGRYFSTIKLDNSLNIPDLVYQGVANSFIVKFDADGKLVWAKKLGESSYEYQIVFSNAIVFDKKGFLYITGRYQGDIDFDLGPSQVIIESFRTGNSFLAKYDLDGNLIWVKGFGGGNSGDSNTSPSGSTLAIDDAHNVYVAGNYDKVANIDPADKTNTLAHSGRADVFVAKFSENGEYIWAKGFGGPDLDFARTLTIKDNSLYIGGTFSGAADFNPTSEINEFTSKGSFDVFFSKFDTDGNYFWTNTFGSTEYDYIAGVEVDGNDDLYLTGTFIGSIDADPSSEVYNISSVGAGDVFFMKCNADGKLLWAKSFGSSAQDSGNSLALDTKGNIVLAGSFGNSITFGAGDAEQTVTTKGSADMFVTMFDPDGTLQWAEGIGGSSIDYSESLATDGKDNFYLSGRYASTVTLKTGNSQTSLTAKGLNDAFVLKFSTSTTVTGTDASDTTTGLKMFPNPATDYLKIISEKNEPRINLRILNTKGQLLLSDTYLATNEVLVDISKLSAGLYFVVIETLNTTTTQKIAIN